MVAVVLFEPYSVSAACDHGSSLSVEDFFVAFPSRFPVPAFVACFQFMADPLRRLRGSLAVLALFRLFA